MELSQHEPIYFLGIGGTGMASTAGLAQEAGYLVMGSDANLYPPMSTMLGELGIDVKTPYDAKNLQGLTPQLVVVANALSRGHVELEEVLSRGLPYTSFPQFLGEYFLKQRCSVVVSGTHGKTTSSSLMAYVLDQLGENPGYMIGGIPRNFPRSFKLGTGSCFVIEGDEYDTAFFDKNSKFLHYQPDFLIFNNLEFDHADIFPNLKAIDAQFHQLLSLVGKKQNILANVDDEGVLRVLAELGLSKSVCRVSAYGRNRNADYVMSRLDLAPGDQTANRLWQSHVSTPIWGELVIKSRLAGPHNAANITQVIACLGRLCEEGIIRRPSATELCEIFASFTGVARRMDHLATIGGIDIFEDFAHHPTAVEQVLQGIRKAYSNRRVLVAFEPKNATSRRNVFTSGFAKALGIADSSYIGPCPADLRIPEEQRMNTRELARQIGPSAKTFTSNEELMSQLVNDCSPGDLVVFMSSGSFSGVQYKLAGALQERALSADS